MTEDQKEKARQRANKWYAENKERSSATKKKYQEENKEYYKMYYKKYGEENRKRRREIVKKYRAENRDIVNAMNAKRRAQKLRATPAWYEQDRDKVDLIYAKAQEFGFFVDHIVPLQSKKVCGLHTWANLQLLAPEVNISKGNRRWPYMP